MATARTSGSRPSAKKTGKETTTGRRPAGTGRRPAGPAPTTVLRVRHGLTPTTGRSLPGRAPGLHLSDAGKAQAQAAVERIAQLGNVTAVYASPLERTRVRSTASRRRDQPHGVRAWAGWGP